MRILIVDDHPVVRGGIRASLRDFDRVIDALEAADLREAEPKRAQNPRALMAHAAGR